MFRNFKELNDVIVDYLSSNEPFSLFRIDNTAGYVMDCINKGTKPLEQFYNNYTLIEAGIYPVSMDYAYDVVNPKTIEVMKNADILGFVDVSGEIKRNTNFLGQFPAKHFFSGGEFLILDPGAILGLSPLGVLDNPWTKYLKGKKVLTISSHHDSIIYQQDKLDLVWGDKKELITPFEFVGCIRTPHHPLIDDRQYPGCETWEDTIEYVKKEIDKYDFDVLLASTSHQAPFYADYAKSKGKVGIQTGGVLQLYFGVLGNRWIHNIGHTAYARWPEMYNEHWIYPLKSDEPQKRDQIGFLETSYAYWG